MFIGEWKSLAILAIETLSYLCGKVKSQED